MIIGRTPHPSVVEVRDVLGTFLGALRPCVVVRHPAARIAPALWKSNNCPQAREPTPTRPYWCTQTWQSSYVCWWQQIA